MKNFLELLSMLFWGLTYIVRVPAAFLLFLLALFCSLLRLEKLAYVLGYSAFYVLGIKDFGSPQ